MTIDRSTSPLSTSEVHGRGRLVLIGEHEVQVYVPVSVSGDSVAELHERAGFSLAERAVGGCLAVLFAAGVHRG